MSVTFTDEQLRNWAENVTEPTVRDLAQALLAKTAECEALRESGEYQYLLVRIAGLEADLARERQRAEASAKALEVEREWRLSPHGGNEATVERLTKERDDARCQLAEEIGDLVVAEKRIAALEAQLAKVPHLQPLGDLRHAYLIGNHAPGEERIEIACARLGGRCAALAAEKAD